MVSFVLCLSAVVKKPAIRWRALSTFSATVPVALSGYQSIMNKLKRKKNSLQIQECYFPGWWLVSNQSGQTGFTPATFLEPVEEKTNKGEWQVVTGPDST